MNQLSINIIRPYNKTHAKCYLLFMNPVSVGNLGFSCAHASAAQLILARPYRILAGWLSAGWSRMTLVRTTGLPTTRSFIP